MCKSSLIFKILSHSRPQLHLSRPSLVIISPCVSIYPSTRIRHRNFCSELGPTHPTFKSSSSENNFQGLRTKRMIIYQSHCSHERGEQDRLKALKWSTNWCIELWKHSYPTGIEGLSLHRLSVKSLVQEVIDLEELNFGYPWIERKFPGKSDYRSTEI